MTKEKAFFFSVTFILQLVSSSEQLRDTKIPDQPSRFGYDFEHVPTKYI